MFTIRFPRIRGESRERARAREIRNTSTKERDEIRHEKFLAKIQRKKEERHVAASS